VALDRQSIEKRDFPIGRRGYDPDAVDSHLALLADEIEQMRRASRQRGDTLASAASEQVRLIVEAAEQSAADIEREADLEARRIRQEAREAAEKARSEAGQTSREHVQRVAEAGAAMLERIDAMETELRGLLDGVRAGATRVSSDLALLQGTVGELRASTGQPFEADPQPQGAPRPAAAANPVPAAAPGASAEPAVAAASPAPESRNGYAEELPGDELEEGDGDRPADEEGARLIALNMALNGTPRSETEQYLEENFDLPDPASLLDDVYAQAGQ
jgi:DivIVA domain-containing protein